MQMGCQAERRLSPEIQGYRRCGLIFSTGFSTNFSAAYPQAGLHLASTFPRTLEKYPGSIVPEPLIIYLECNHGDATSPRASAP